MKPAPRTVKANVPLFIVAILVIVFDQMSKRWAIDALADGAAHPGIPHVLDFVFVKNTHGAYGLFGDQPWFLIAISFAAFVVIYMSFRDRAKESPFVASALGLVLGGAIGNVIDRFHYHFVVDFIRLIPLPIFEVFNVADTAISIGIGLIIIASFQRERAVKTTESL